VTVRRRIALVASLGLLSVLAPARDAAAWAPLDASTPRWDRLPVGYFVNRSTVPASISSFAIARVDAGFAAWSSPGCSAWLTENLGDTADTYNYRDNKNVFRWISSSWPSELGDVNSVIGVTIPVWGFDDVIVDADMVFNDVGFCWNDSGTRGCVDTQSIATHEEGHFLGLGHTNVADATMAAFYADGSSLRTLADDDIEGVCALYPIGGTAAASTGGGASDCGGCFNGSLASGGECEARFADCRASSSCVEFFNCVAECQDDGCIEGCVDASPDGARIYADMVDCVCDDCATECVAECGGGAGGASASSSSGTGGPASSSTAGGAGGAGGFGGASSGGGAGGEVRPTSQSEAPGSEGGCACSAGGAPASPGGLLLFAALGALRMRRRRG
jgi:MYXO-CTERM domain-containing protein